MRCLILGGGGPLGAFSAGALDVLERSPWNPDAFVGSSAGSINLVRYLVGGADAATEFWTGLRWTTLLLRGVHRKLKTRGLLDPVSFHAHVESGLSFEALHRDPRLFAFIVVDLNTGKVRLRGNRTEASAESLRSVVRGSYALPPLLPPVPNAPELLADGGLLINAPLDKCIKLGATEIVYLCNVHALPHTHDVSPSTWTAATRYADVFFRRASNVGFADAEVKEGTYRGVRFVAIAPPPEVRLGAMARKLLPRAGVMQGLVDAGRKSAMRALEVTPWLRGADGAAQVSPDPQARPVRAA